MTIEILGRDTSYNVQKVLWLLDELQLKYDHEQVGGKYGGTDSNDFALKNPFRKVPVLVDSGHSVYESNTILRYLAATYGAPHWWSDSPIDRAMAETWMDWSIDNLEPAFIGVFWGFYRTPASKRDWKHIESSKVKCVYCLSKVEEQLSQSEFLSGNIISIADVAVGVFIYRLLEIDLGIQLQNNTNIWYQHLCKRQGYQSWVMSDFSELKGREGY